MYSTRTRNLYIINYLDSLYLYMSWIIITYGRSHINTMYYKKKRENLTN